MNAIRAARTPPPIASRALAILHIAIFDAVNGVDRACESYLVPSEVEASASRGGASTAAAHQVLTTLFPASTASFDALRASRLAAIPDGPQKKAGIAWGEAVAIKVLASRNGDGSGAIVAPPNGSGPGAWVPTPPANAAYLLPGWGMVKPFIMTNGFQFRPPGPPNLGSAKWAADYNEVKALGAASGSTRTAEQTQIALFWADGAGTQTPPGHWNTIAQIVAIQRGNTLEENARLFALLNIALADAAICAWDAKYTYNFWRPVTAIRNGGTDNNGDTAPDSSWSSFIVTPPFPDYVSGHSTFSGAASKVLAMFFGSDNISFTVGSDGAAGTRDFTSFLAAANEAALSRLYGGIHYRSANDDGLASGLAIGEWAFNHCLQAKGNRSKK
jgi:hypothetical protein